MLFMFTDFQCKCKKNHKLYCFCFLQIFKIQSKKRESYTRKKIAILLFISSAPAVPHNRHFYYFLQLIFDLKLQKNIANLQENYVLYGCGTL